VQKSETKLCSTFENTTLFDPPPKPIPNYDYERRRRKILLHLSISAMNRARDGLGTLEFNSVVSECETPDRESCNYESACTMNEWANVPIPTRNNQKMHLVPISTPPKNSEQGERKEGWEHEDASTCIDKKRKTSKNKLRRTLKELSRNRFFQMYACWLRMNYSSWKSWAANIVFCSFSDTITNWWTKVDCLPPIPSSREGTRNKVDWECEQFSFCKAASTQNGIFNGKTSVDILISKVWSLWDDVLERRN